MYGDHSRAIRWFRIKQSLGRIENESAQDEVQSKMIGPGDWEKETPTRPVAARRKKNRQEKTFFEGDYA